MQVAIEHHTSAAHLNSIANHPDVYPWVKGGHEGPIDFGPVMGRPDIIPLHGEYGGQIYRWLLPALWEAHSQFVPQGRGPWALEATRKSLHWMFTRTDAVEIVTRCPEGNTAAKALAKIIGGTLQFTHKNGWVMNGKVVPADIYSLKIEDWMRDAPSLVEKGQWFHRRLKEELARVGIAEPQHEDDEVHDRYVGATWEMLTGGQPLKGQIYYNRFAVMAGYQPINIVAVEPLAVDIGTTLLVLRGDDFYIPTEKELAH